MFWFMLAALTTKNVKVEDVVNPFLGFLVRLLNTYDSSHSPPQDFLCPGSCSIIMETHVRKMVYHHFADKKCPVHGAHPLSLDTFIQLWASYPGPGKPNDHLPYRCLFFRSDDGLSCPFSSTLQKLRDGESELGKDCCGKKRHLDATCMTFTLLEPCKYSRTFARTSICIYNSNMNIG